MANIPPEKCERCNGQGCVPVLCPKCQGETGMTFRKCTRCKGTGSIDVPCKTCSGTGEVIEQVEKE